MKELHVRQHLTTTGLSAGTKTGADDVRSISLPTWVADLLMTRYETSGPDGPVFRNTHGGRLTVDLAEKKFRAICDEAGLPSIASTTCDTLR